MKIFFLSFPVLFLMNFSSAQERCQIVWTDSVSETSKKLALEWLDSTMFFIEECYGKYPDGITFYLSPKEMNVNIGWASAKFHESIKGVYMDVDLTDCTLSDLLEDWRPPHEISHLALPFFGKKYRWLSEGFATYMSRQVMLEMGYYSEESLAEYYQGTFRKVAHYFNGQESFEEAAINCVNNYQYDGFYSGGSTFYYLVDKVLLANEKPSLVEIIKEYQVNGKSEDFGKDEIFQSLDELIGFKVFERLYLLYHSQPAHAIMSYVLEN